jgi:hypothetical protein
MYNSRLSTAHKSRVALGGNTNITVDELFLILEMAHFQSGDKLQKKIYKNTFKILEKNAAESTLTKTVFNKIRKETIALFNEDKAPTLKVLKMDLSKVKGCRVLNAPTTAVVRCTEWTTTLTLGADPDFIKTLRQKGSRTSGPS